MRRRWISEPFPHRIGAELDRSSVPLVGADGNDHLGVLGGIADRMRLRRGYRKGLLKQPLMLLGKREGRLDEREIRTVGNDGLGKRGETHPLLAQFANFFGDLLDCPLSAVQHGPDLYGGCLDHFSHSLLLLIVSIRALHCNWCRGRRMTLTGALRAHRGLLDSGLCASAIDSHVDAGDVGCVAQSEEAHAPRSSVAYRSVSRVSAPAAPFRVLARCPRKCRSS